MSRFNTSINLITLVFLSTLWGPEANAEKRRFIVRTKDTLSEISTAIYGTKKYTEDIGRWSNLENLDQIEVGQILYYFVPPDSEKASAPKSEPLKRQPKKIQILKYQEVQKKFEKEFRKTEEFTFDRRFDRGRFNFEKKKYSDALVELEKALTLKPKNIATRILWFRTLKKLGRNDEADLAKTTILKDNPKLGALKIFADDNTD